MADCVQSEYPPYITRPNGIQLPNIIRGCFSFSVAVLVPASFVGSLYQVIKGVWNKTLLSWWIQSSWLQMLFKLLWYVLFRSDMEVYLMHNVQFRKEIEGGWLGTGFWYLGSSTGSSSLASINSHPSPNDERQN